MNREEDGILRTLSYADVFNYPLKGAEIFTYYMGGSEVGAEAFGSSLARLLAEGKIAVHHPTGFYFFPDRSQIVAKRLEREVVSRRLLEKAYETSRLIFLIPWVKLVSVTGALAVENSDEGDDVDLMVVTSPGRLWLTRFLVFSSLKIFGQKKGGREGQAGSGSFCVNVWMTEADLAVGSDDQDLVVAHDIVRMKVLFDKTAVFRKLIDSNLWVRRFFPNLPPVGEVEINLEGQKAPSRSIGFPGLLLGHLEEILRRFQLFIIRRNFPGNPYIKESSSRLWQHPTNTRGRVLSAFEENLKRRR